MKRALSVFMFVLLLVNTLTFAFNTQNVRASGTIYIRADGSIDPPDAPISTVDNVTYTLTGNITSDADGIVVERDNIVVDGAGYTIQGIGTGTGFYGSGISNVTIKNTNIKNHFDGILLYSSSGSSISGNSITANNWYGILLYISSGSSISGNSITANNADGIVLVYSSSSSISGNSITANNGSGIVLDSSSGSNISGNNITSNDCGIWLYPSSGSSIFHNHFTDNDQQAVSIDSINIWDDGYPSGGNYWSDYTGIDQKSGSYQNETGSDGIGDTPYVIDEDNQDNYPLMKSYPWGQHDIGIVAMNTSKGGCLPMETVGQNCSMRINLMLFNYGNDTETFNVTIYANSVQINVTQIALAGRGYATLAFAWNTTDVAFGNYTISAYAEPVENETDTTDNELTTGIILVTIPGDINGDQYVNAKDAVLLGSAFYPAGMYNPNADINDDDWCNAKDAVILGTYFGQHW